MVRLPCVDAPGEEHGHHADAAEQEEKLRMRADEFRKLEVMDPLLVAD